MPRGAFILAVFVALFNCLTPSGSFTVSRKLIQDFQIEKWH